jgi:hypothetical protein
MLQKILVGRRSHSLSQFPKITVRTTKNSDNNTPQRKKKLHHLQYLVFPCWVERTAALNHYKKNQI